MRSKTMEAARGARGVRGAGLTTTAVEVSELGNRVGAKEKPVRTQVAATALASPVTVALTVIRASWGRIFDVPLLAAVIVIVTWVKMEIIGGAKTVIWKIITFKLMYSSSTETHKLGRWVS